MASIVGVTLGLLFIVGIGYALYIAKWPFPSGLTWLGVVIGCSFTNVAISIVVWELTRDWRAALVAPWGCYVLTGIPMILGQIFKNQAQFNEACRFVEECGRDQT